MKTISPKKLRIMAVCFLVALTFLLSEDGFSQERELRKKTKKQQETTLTNEQVKKVKSILADYDPKTLTSEKAIKINELFRDAGIKNGPGLHQAIRDAGFDPEELGRLAPRPDRPGRDDNRSPDKRGQRPPNDKMKKGSGNKYSIEQAISDHAQLHTIAFDALAFITGDLCGDSFLPPGKVSDFFGFQYLRDTDQGEMGHNTSFVPRSANNVLYILDDSQVNQLITLANEQKRLIQEFAYKRFPLMKVFRRLQANDIPNGKVKLSLDAVKEYSTELYQIDGLLSYQRAEVLGHIIRSLTDKQKAYLDRMKGESSLKWPEKNDQLDKKRFSHEIHVAVMTYASELFSWYAGSVEADTYFCPERHGMYFGSFFMKDIPAMGNKNYSISTELTGDKGKAFLNILNEDQRNRITGLVNIQKKTMQEIVNVRLEISGELRKFMEEQSIDKDLVLNLASRYGELDGEISYYYAVNFSRVFQTLTDDQLNSLNDLRDLDDYPCNGAYLYSQKISMPKIGNTDRFFE